MVQPSAYLIDFNETVQVPRNRMASVFPWSSLWRSGIGITASVGDAGYQGAMGALMEVKNPRGVVLYKDAKLAQIVFEELGETSRDTMVFTSFLQLALDWITRRRRNIRRIEMGEFDQFNYQV